MTDSQKALEAYLVKVLNDKKASTGRRDRAATQLGRLLGKQAKRGKRAQREVDATEGTTTGYVSVKRAKRDKANRIASSSDWADLIPKAKVVPIRGAGS